MSVNSNTALKDIYGYRANVRKSLLYKAFSDFMGDVSTHTVINKARHGFKKRILCQAVSDSAMSAMEEHILKIVRRFCDHLVDGNSTNAGVEGKESIDVQVVRNWSREKDMAAWTNYFSFDVMGELCFGKTFGMMERDDNRYILEVIMDGTQGLNAVRQGISILRASSIQHDHFFGCFDDLA